MSNTHIETVENGFEKADNYRYQMERYNLAIQHEFYFEAIVIAYAMIEDRLLAFLHYAGVIDRRQQSDQAEHGIMSLLNAKSRSMFFSDVETIIELI